MRTKQKGKKRYKKKDGLKAKIILTFWSTKTEFQNVMQRLCHVGIQSACQIPTAKNENKTKR